MAAPIQLEKGAPAPKSDVKAEIVRYRDVIAEQKGKDEVPILDAHGFVRLVDCTPRVVRADSLGVESRIVEAARVCYGAGTKSVRDDLALLSYLYRHEHLTPFEMVDFTFIASVPMFVANQLKRHRAASYNEESARYSVIGDHFYAPTPDDIRAQSKMNRQGSTEMKDKDIAFGFSQAVTSICPDIFQVYNHAVSNGIAREMARIVLPEGRYTKLYVKMNLRNLLHFLNLRMDAHAQQEMREFATAIYGLVRQVAPHAIDVFDRHTRGAMRFSRDELAILSDLIRLKEVTLPDRLSKGEKEELIAKFATLSVRMKEGRLALGPDPTVADEPPSATEFLDILKISEKTSTPAPTPLHAEPEGFGSLPRSMPSLTTSFGSLTTPPQSWS